MLETMTSPMRDRLLEAASELFYAEGLRAVSVDKIIEHAGTTKVTFYRHFKSKDDLVVAYLERTAVQEREAIDGAIASSNGDVDDGLRLLSEQFERMACGPGFRGCAFTNAAAEYPDADSPIRRVIRAQRDWTRKTFERLLAPLGLPDPAAVADDLTMLRHGALVAAYIGDPSTVAASFLRSSRAITGVSSLARS